MAPKKRDNPDQDDDSGDKDFTLEDPKDDDEDTGGATAAGANAPPWTGAEFLQVAQPLSIDVAQGLVSLEAKPREFARGSYGWNSTGRMKINIDGRDVSVTCSLNLTVMGSNKKKPRTAKSSPSQ